jgi:threonine/homoserine efflux transporter RhtA
MSPVFSLLLAAGIVTVFFNIVNLGKLKETYKKCWQQKASCLGIMITILVMWNCAMTAPGLIGASLTNFIVFAWLGTLGFLVSGINNRINFYAGIFVLSLIVFVIATTLLQEYSIHKLEGIIIALISGTSSYVYFKQSQSLVSKINLSSTQILSFRFYLTMIVLYCLLPKESFSLYFNLKNLLEIIVLAVAGMIIPLYFQQKALEKISSEQNAIIMSLTPVAISFVQDIVFKDVDFRYLVVYLLYTTAVTFPYVWKNLKKGAA